MLAYVLDPVAGEGRNWVNDGSVEDIATGSAAGPAASYLVRHGLRDAEREIVIKQGRFLGRPSEMTLRVACAEREISRVELIGDVAFAGGGYLFNVP